MGYATVVSHRENGLYIKDQETDTFHMVVDSRDVDGRGVAVSHYLHSTFVSIQDQLHCSVEDTNLKYDIPVRKIFFSCYFFAFFFVCASIWRSF